MALKLPVLVRGINNLSDARYCAGMGADGLIFTLDPTLPGAVDVATVRELAGWVSGVELIGEFGQMSAAAINKIATQCALDRVFLRFQMPPETSEALVAPALMELRQMTVLDATYHEQVVQAATSNFPAGVEFITNASALQANSVELFAAAARRFPLWLIGQFQPETITELLQKINPTGLILQGGNEIKPGLRDFTELEAIFEALETDD